MHAEGFKFEFFVLRCSRSTSNATGRAVDCKLDQPSELLQLEISCDQTFIELVDQVSNNASVQLSMACIVMASIVMACILRTHSKTFARKLPPPRNKLSAPSARTHQTLATFATLPSLFKLLPGRTFG